MSATIWKAYWEDNVDKFRRLLAPAGYNAQAISRSPNVGGAGTSLGASPRAGAKSRKVSGHGSYTGGGKHGGGGIGKVEINSRDHAGLTILLRAASSTNDNALPFVQALLDHPAIDTHAQDPESGWNALHRALYAGNISIARLLLEKERVDFLGQTRVGQLIKTKDHEGNSPFDLYHATIGERHNGVLHRNSDSDSDSDSDNASSDLEQQVFSDTQALLAGDEIFTFGSNKNRNLGLGDEDDRQYPERVYLQRPDQAVRRVYEDFLGKPVTASDLAKIPAQILSRPLVISDVQLAKYHSAVLTTDAVSNLYMSGIGRGGRLGLGDENTRFNFTPVSGALANKKVVKVALGQNHSMAITDTGELWSWGSNTESQLGYSLPQTTKPDDDPMSVTPRQVFGPLKKEVVLGCAASAIHSVAFTGSSLYCWGKNIGQLALMDADSRSLEIQQTPRKVAASLFSSPIAMVSAIDKATTCLLADHTVFVFTSYGYKNVKFPVPDIMLDRSMTSRVPVTSRYETARNRIACIASGGETIAAVSERGDLFTMSLNHNTDTTEAATSTTNPSKIKNALSQPQCIWTARKDGVRSVDVGEHGSVIIATFSGAVWRRVKRNKAKDNHVSGPADSKRRDFKFQRVPYVTDVVTVRSSVFGAFAAVRRDNRIIKEQIVVDPQTLWDDVAPLICLDTFRSTGPKAGDKDAQRMWTDESVRQRLGSVSFEILKSSDLESDLQRFLSNTTFDRANFDVVMQTTSYPEIQIPVHSWILAARSTMLRDGLAQSRKMGKYSLPDILEAKTENGTTTLVFHGLDIISILNLAVYAYQDKVVPAWNFTKYPPSMAPRYRQIRAELMKLAPRLNMPSLEVAVRQQVNPRRTMATDFNHAVRTQAFLGSGDVLLELDGAEVPVHSSFLVKRCPWFTGLFQGRSSGGWLAGRRDEDPSGRIKIDLKHMDANAFSYVLRHLYSDAGPELFDSVVSDGLSDFTDLVMDVMSIANELMIDRLSQICQLVMGQHVNTRNAAHFLNAISPCTMTDFKDCGLEYICLQMESMLENHLLDDLEEELLFELDEVVRENQEAQLPISRSGRAEAELLDRYPELAEDIDEERRRRVRHMAFKASQRDEDRKLSSSFKAKFGSLDESTFASPPPNSGRRKSKTGHNAPFSPSIRPKASQADLMFDMDDDDDSPELNSPILAPQLGQSGRTRTIGESDPQVGALGSLEATSRDIGRSQGQQVAFRLDTDTVASPETITKPDKPWGSSAPLDLKPTLRDIMSEATGSGKSALSAGLAAQKGKEASVKPAQIKVSQKERKRQQMQAALAAQEQANAPNQKPWETASPKIRAAPWKTSEPPPKQSIKDMLEAPQSSPASLHSKPLVAADSLMKPISRRTASPDTRFAGQKRPTPPMRSPAGSSTKINSSATPLVPHSKSYITPPPKSDPLVGYSMADIIGQQQREQEIVKEAVAKRSLQEIQEEQAFQEWWDQESLRTQEEEARRAARGKEREEAKGRGRRGRSGRSRGGGSAAGGRGGSSNVEVAGGGGGGREGTGNNARGKRRGVKS